MKSGGDVGAIIKPMTLRNQGVSSSERILPQLWRDS